jgi:drug/metabolite transporter (DMT)-like permease
MTVVLAFLASTVVGIGAALQQQAASDEDPHAVMDPRLVFRLLRRKTWLLGISVSMVGFGLQATAIATGRLVLVEPIMAGHVLFALLVSARRSGRRLGPREWRGAAATLVGVTGFLVLASPQEADEVHEVVPWLVPIGILAVLVVAGVGLAPRLVAERRGVVLSLLAGLSFGTADGLLKVFTGVGGDHGVAGVFGHWGIWAWLVVSPTAFLLQQSAFHATHLGAALPGTATLAPVTAAVLGATMFGEQIRGGWWVPGEVVFAVVMLTGVFLLSSSPLIDLNEPSSEADPDVAPAVT